MNRVRHDRQEAERLTPLLLAIGREVDERFQSLRALGRKLSRTRVDDREAQRIVAEMALHKRALRRAERELGRHGAGVMGTRPLTLRLAVQDAGRASSILLRLEPPLARKGA